MIDICMLGTCGMMPLPGRWLSCALLRCGATLTLFDCGEGTQVPWKMLGWGFRQLGAICLTHMHADHVAGLPGVLFMVAHAGRTEPLDIYGPVGTAYVVEGLRRIAADLPFPIRIHELKGGEQFALPGELQASCASAAHGSHAWPIALIWNVGQRFRWRKLRNWVTSSTLVASATWRKSDI